MSDLDYQSDRDPVFWFRGFPVRAAVLLVVIHTVSLLLCLILTTADRPGALALLTFFTPTFLRGWVWTPFTYGWVHPPGEVLNFAISMYMLWVFGGQVEHFFGRRIFLKLYALLWLLTPAALLALVWLGPQYAQGASATHLGIFIAFAALYPSVPIFFGIAARWVALILLGIYSVQDIANAQWVQLILVWVMAAAAWAFVGYQRGQFTIQLPSFLRRQPKFRVLPKPEAVFPRRRPAPVPATPSSASMDDVDALLDKIARTGMSSLSSEERSRLERASADLKRNR